MTNNNKKSKNLCWNQRQRSETHLGKTQVRPYSIKKRARVVCVLTCHSSLPKAFHLLLPKKVERRETDVFFQSLRHIFHMGPWSILRIYNVHFTFHYSFTFNLLFTILLKESLCAYKGLLMGKLLVILGKKKTSFAQGEHFCLQIQLEGDSKVSSPHWELKRIRRREL